MGAAAAYILIENVPRIDKFDMVWHKKKPVWKQPHVL